MEEEERYSADIGFLLRLSAGMLPPGSYSQTHKPFTPHWRQLRDSSRHCVRACLAPHPATRARICHSPLDPRSVQTSALSVSGLRPIPAVTSAGSSLGQQCRVRPPGLRWSSDPSRPGPWKRVKSTSPRWQNLGRALEESNSGQGWRARGSKRQREGKNKWIWKGGGKLSRDRPFVSTTRLAHTETRWNTSIRIKLETVLLYRS